MKLSTNFGITMISQLKLIIQLAKISEYYHLIILKKNHFD